MSTPPATVEALSIWLKRIPARRAALTGSSNRIIPATEASTTRSPLKKQKLGMIPPAIANRRREPPCIRGKPAESRVTEGSATRLFRAGQSKINQMDVKPPQPRVVVTKCCSLMPLLRPQLTHSETKTLPQRAAAKPYIG